MDTRKSTIVRPLLAADSAACAALRREMLADSPWAFSSSVESDRGVDPEQVAARLAEPRQVTIGAFDPNGTLLGVAGMYRDTHAKMSHRARIWGVYVTPHARGFGLARRIVARALDEASAWPGVNSAALSCSERSLAARKTYESLGFTAWGCEPAALIVDGTSYAEYHMVVML